MISFNFNSATHHFIKIKGLKNQIYFGLLILFYFLSSSGLQAQTTIAIEDFDSVTPAWTNNISGLLFVDPSTSSEGLFIQAASANNANFSGNTLFGRDLEGEAGEPSVDPIDFVFDNVDVSAFTNVVLSFDFHVFANVDIGTYTLVLDGVDQTAVEYYNDPDTSPGISGTISENIPAGTGTVGLKIGGSLNGGSDILELDNFKLVGTASSSNTSVEFVSATSSIAEDGGTIDVCVAITNPDATNATTVEVALAASGNTATNGTDYSTIIYEVTLTFPAGSSASECVTFTITDDTDVEGDETIDLILQNPAGGNSATLGTSTSHVLTITENDVAPSGIAAIGTCSGITAANENMYNISITGLDSGTTYDFDLDGDGVDDVTGITGVTSYITTTGIAFVDGTNSQTVQVDAGADGSYETIIVVHEVLCTDADDDDDLDFGSGCDEDLASTDRGYIVATVAPYNGNNVYVYVLTDASDVVQNSNTSGLFTGLANGGNGATNDHNVVAFNFANNVDAQTFIASLTVGTSTVTTATMPTGCSMACGTMAYNIECRMDDVALTKVVNSGSISSNLNVGDKVTFDITVFNQGSDPVFDIAVNDYISTGFDFLTADNMSNAFSGVAADVLGGGTVSTTLSGPIASNGMELIQIVLTVNASATNTNLTNQAEITAALQSAGGNPIMDEDTDLANTNPTVANETDDDVNDNPDNPNDEDDSDFAVVTLCSNPVATVNDPVVCESTTSATLTVSATSGTPTEYTIDYDAAAVAEGFMDVTTATSLTGATFVIPMTAAPETYSGVLTYIDANGCSGTDAFTITLEATPVATAGSDEAICADETTFDLSTATTTATASNGTIQWTADNGNGTPSDEGSFSDPTALTPIYTPSAADLAAGSVTLTITVTTTGTGGCPNASDMMTLTFDTPVLVEAGTTTTVCSNGTVDLSALGASISGGTTAGTWSSTTGGTFDDGAGVFGTATTYTPSAMEIAAGSVTLTLTSANPASACPAVDDTVTVSISNVECGTFPWDGN